MVQDKGWCVAGIDQIGTEYVGLRKNYYAMQTKEIPYEFRIKQDLTKEEAEGLMKLLRPTQGESK